VSLSVKSKKKKKFTLGQIFDRMCEEAVAVECRCKNLVAPEFYFLDHHVFFTGNEDVFLHIGQRQWPCDGQVNVKNDRVVFKEPKGWATGPDDAQLTWTFIFYSNKPMTL